MKKLLLALALISQIALAQRIDVQTVSSIKGTETGGFYYPVFSPKGDYLLTTSENYTGLKQYVFSNKSFKTITTDAGAGYGVQISADGTLLAYKKNTFINNLRHSSLITQSLATGKKTILVTPTRDAITPKFAANKPQYVKSKQLVATNITRTEATPVISIENQKMVIYNGSNRKVLIPNGLSASYIWPSISPDKRNIVYTVAGKGTFVCRIDGSNPVSIGKVNAPVWLNNQWIVGMDDKDDGQNTLSSTLIATTINGKTRQTILAPTGKMAMYPTASADGKHIAFNTDKGEIYILDIKIN